MDIETRLFVLEQIYTIYDNFSDTLDIACKKKCSLCCTQNVTMTTLEAYKIITSLEPDNHKLLFDNLKKAAPEQRYSPRFTLNALSRLSADGEDIPDKVTENSEGSCPLLQNNECPIYPYRPFGCRCFFSTHNCNVYGEAAIDPFTITVNNVFLQYIEHIDAKGLTANFTDMLLLLDAEENQEKYKKETLNPDGNFISNQPLEVHLIPPEHRTRIQSLLEQLQSIKVPAATTPR